MLIRARDLSPRLSMRCRPPHRPLSNHSRTRLHVIPNKISEHVLIADTPLWGGIFLVLRLTNNKDGREMCDFADQKPVILTRTTNLWVRAKIVQAAGTSPKIGNARFRSVLGACGMHGRVRAGRRRRCGRVQGHVSPRPSGTPAARSAARPRPLGRTSPDSPFCWRLDACLDACPSGAQSFT